MIGEKPRRKRGGSTTAHALVAEADARVADLRRRKREAQAEAQRISEASAAAKRDLDQAIGEAAVSGAAIDATKQRDQVADLERQAREVVVGVDAISEAIRLAEQDAERVLGEHLAQFIRELEEVGAGLAEDAAAIAGLQATLDEKRAGLIAEYVRVEHNTGERYASDPQTGSPILDDRFRPH